MDKDTNNLITKRLIIFSAATLGLTAILFGATILLHLHFFISWFSVQVGIIGGFVSIKQRLGKMTEEELTVLSGSWASTMIVPIYGGIFALVLYVIFLSGLVKSDLFPIFYVPKFDSPPTRDNLISLFSETSPLTAIDFAKFTFWSFVAGFSERFVPQLIESLESKPFGTNNKPEDKNPKK